MVLRELWEEDGLKGGELAARLAVEPPTVSRMLGRLEACGLLERRRDPEDARSFRVCLTAKGRDLRRPVEDLWQRVEERAFEGMSEEEKHGLKGLLVRVRENLSAG
ncbi:MarR family transcriptional regulator [Rubrobacter marinus]|uniref:MarR family transcriptional regulator n=2 Tax=Rubrobacter marinus TaxID=2653852 RepID=A0A6G8Q2T7_9ACTN|nr:MarR family transcriptional regulator [Rubrobacter marinus]